MEVDILAAALDAAQSLADPARFGFLLLGVLVGLILGVIPGLNGIVGLALLLPFTFDMDIVAALAFLLGVSAVVVTSDTIPAVLFGVPGTAGSAATILDGHPMAEQGRAAEALGAGFSSSLIGGIFGAALLAVSLPLLKPFMLLIATPELLAICIFGLSLIVVLSTASLSRGIIACCIGIAFSTIGDDTQTATLRWTFDFLYLYDGIPLVPVVLGIFAIPQLAWLSARKPVSPGAPRSITTGSKYLGLKSTFRNMFLVLRCSSIGALLGAIPGIGLAIIDWVAYGHAKRTEKGAVESFGTGDVRGVIASESSNNAKEGGALIPTIIFGIPGSATMVLLLGAFLARGIVPGPGMLEENIGLTYTMVWSIALANIIGAGLCFIFTPQLTRIALVRVWVLVPLVSSLVVIGALQGSRHWADLLVLLFFGLLGLVMKYLGWPRPALVLGFVLGGLLERYSYITTSRYGYEWIFRPAVMAILLMTAIGLLLPLLRQWVGKVRSEHSTPEAPVFRSRYRYTELAFSFLLLVLFSLVIYSSSDWDVGARLLPSFIGLIAIACLLYVVASNLRHSAGGPEPHCAGDERQPDPEQVLLPRKVAGFVIWFVAMLLVARGIGVIPALTLFTLLYIRFVGREGWLYSILVALGFLVANVFLFAVLLRLKLPTGILFTGTG